MAINEYYEALSYIMENGKAKEDRTGVGTLSVTSVQIRVKNEAGKLPLIGHKYTSSNIVEKELAWMLSGGHNIKDLKDNNVNIWNEWADEDGSLGRIYGFQWRQGFSIDQIATVLNIAKKDRFSRRLIVTAWNPSDLGFMALPPCHHTFQFVFNGESFDIVLTQRSGDMFLGIPYNISFYALLNKMFNWAVLGKDIDSEVILNVSDAHIYLNHIEQSCELITRYVTPIEESKEYDLRGYFSSELATETLLSTDFYKTIYYMSKMIDWKHHTYKHQGKIAADVAV